MARSRFLIVYYSRSGTTRKVAEALAAALSCDIEEIVEPRGRAGPFGAMRSALEAILRRPAPIAATKLNPLSYDLVIVGTPVWAWSVSSPVRAFLAANKSRLPDVAFFCSLGNSGHESAFAQMRSLAGKTPRAKGVFVERDVKAGTFAPQLADFVKMTRGFVLVDGGKSSPGLRSRRGPDVERARG